MRAMASGAEVVCTTVGPYAKYGMTLAEACAREGTHYADLTGEVLFVRSSIDRYHAAAEASGARIVHSCGYDSIPSDLGVLMVYEAARAAGAGPLTDALLVAKGKGGVSGGTIDSLRTQVDAVRADPTRQQIIDDPYALSPDRAGEADMGPQSDNFRPRRDPMAGEWIGPFVMGAFNTRIVRRSNALQAWAYGRSLRYQEAMAGGPAPFGPILATGMGVALRASAPAMSFSPTRAVLDRFLPKPGGGPSEATQRRGYFRSDIYAGTNEGARYHGVIAGDGDPGYSATAVMLGESALCLALNRAQLPDRSGVLTPATAMGHVLTGRLRKAGFRCEVGTT